MHYSLVNGFSDDEVAAIWNGQTLPIPSIIRDEQGVKTLLVPGEKIPVHIWSAACLASVDFIYRPNGERVTVAEFIELADLHESESLYTLPSFIWHLPDPEEVKVAQNRSEGHTEPFYEDDEPLENIKKAWDEGEELISAPPEGWESEEGLFVHLHTHSEFSALDGLANMDEIVAQAVAQNQKSVAITDHGVCAGHPSLQKACEAAGIKPIFGMEAYLVDDRFSREDAKDYYHITLWAMTDQGLRNLWAISTEGYRDGFHGHPRVDWDTLTRLNEGIIASSGCLRGPVPREIMNGSPNRALVNSQKLMDIFGDRYYIEIHANHLEPQIKVNKWLVGHAQEFNIPMVAAVDSHYATHDQRDHHQVWLSVQTNKDVEDESSLFGGGQDYHMMNEEQLFSALSYLGEEVAFTAMTNTLKLAERCNARIQKINDMPSYTGDLERDRELALKVIEDNFAERVRDKPYTQEQAMDRIMAEWDILDPKNFWGYFLQNWDIVSYAKDNGVRVGPGRGSGAGCYIAYLMRITEIDSLEHDLDFARFMTKGRTALPDFDIDYPSSRKQFMIDYAEGRWGKQHVCAVGTVTRLKNKGAFADTARAIRSRLPETSFNDSKEIAKIITAAEASTAGLGLKWEELFDSVGDQLEPYAKIYPELFELAAIFRDRVKTYSRHAAGLIINPQADLEGTLPMFLSPDEKTLVTQFDKDVLEDLGYVKFDFLNLRNLDTIQLAIDLIQEQLGVSIDMTKWRDEYYDSAVFDDISDGWTLGLFQMETSLGTKTVKQLKPKSLSDMADCITLGRPGPIRSGLDKTYFARRSGKQKVSFADPRLSEVLARSYGTMIYQEDIMAICRVLAGYSDDEADKVRKILGKKKPEEAKLEGIKFIKRAVENNTDEKIATDLWEQMEEFSRYSFNRAHAFAYAAIAYWTAWFKIHYPVQFTTAILSTIDKEEIPGWVSEARRLGFKVLPPDINDSKRGFHNTVDTVRYGLDSIKGIGDAATEAIIQGQPYSSWDDFVERKGDKCNMGHIKILAHVGAFDSISSNRKALEARLSEEDIKPGERCIFYDAIHPNKYNSLPCGFDWDSEPKKLGRTGKPLKNQKPVPTKCARSCRQWTPRDLPSDGEIVPYTDAEIRDIEIEALGIYLSSSPFDVVDRDSLALLSTANEILTEDSGVYLSVVMVMKVKQHITKDDKEMQFVTVDTPSGSMDITVFNDKLEKYRPYLIPGKMNLVEVQKNDRGITLRAMENI